MAGYQFIHVDCYARRASTKQPNSKAGKATKARAVKLNASQVAAEADREPDAIPHVEKPLEPVVIFGCSAKQVVAEAEKRAEASTDTKGRKVRADTAIMLAGVASHPFSPDEVAADLAKRAEYEEWRKLTIEHLQRKYGTALKSVIEHRDESHMHVHFYAVPDAGKGFNAKDLHDGFAAAKDAKDAKEQKRLYTTAMRKLQDDYFAEVGAKCGQARTGPQRERLTRADWKQRQHQVEHVAQVMQRAETLEKQAQERAKLIEAKAPELVAKIEAEALARAKQIEAQAMQRAKKIEAKAMQRAKQIIADAMEKARKPAQLIGAAASAFLDTITGRGARLRREAEERVAKERERAERAKRAEADAKRQAEEWQQKVLHERLKNDSTVDKLVALKTLPLQKRVKVLEEKNAELVQQLDSLSSENKEMSQKLTRKPAGPSLGDGKKV